MPDLNVSCLRRITADHIKNVQFAKIYLWLIEQRNFFAPTYLRGKWMLRVYLFLYLCLICKIHRHIGLQNHRLNSDFSYSHSLIINNPLSTDFYFLEATLEATTHLCCLNAILEVKFLVQLGHVYTKWPGKWTASMWYLMLVIDLSCRQGWGSIFS